MALSKVNVIKLKLESANGWRTISRDAKEGGHGITGEPPLEGHDRERVPELGATITTDLISSIVDREYPAQVVMLT